MQTGQASRTALGAAAHRAVHQVLERGSVFADPLAVRILGADADAAIEEARRDPSLRPLRMFIAMRSRIAEEALAAAIECGATQLVVLGAGLDTFAYRGVLRERVRIFEVDHPATQAWKRERLAAAAIAAPPTLAFVPVDLERATLADALAAAGFEPARRTFFTWLGVVPYLADAAVFATLGFIAGQRGGAQVVFDYATPLAAMAREARAAHEALAARVAEAGEAFRSFYDPEAIGERLRALGFRSIDDLGPAQLAARFFPGRATTATAHGGHIVAASTIG